MSTATDPLVVVCEVAGGRAVAQFGETLYVLSDCCRRVYKAAPKHVWADGTVGAQVCLGCDGHSKPLPVDPANPTPNAWWSLRVPLDATRTTEAIVTEWVAAWLGREVESVQLVQTS